MKSGSDVILHTAQGMPITPRNLSQHRIVSATQNADIVFAIGAAGTGKTFISIALALAALKERHIKRIVITRPAVEAGEHLGFLPGDLHEKLDPYLAPIYDALYSLLPRAKADAYLESNVIEIVPLAYMRGRTFNKAFIIADEMQNATYTQLKMLLTRMGLNSQMLINGDPSQTDLPQRRYSCLWSASDILHYVHDIKFVEMSSADVVRHQLVGSIIDAYDDYEKFDEASLKTPQELTNGVATNGVH